MRWTTSAISVRRSLISRRLGEAARSAAAPAVPSCPGWVVTDLVLHLGFVHRLVARVVGERMQQPPAVGDRSWLGLPGPWLDWLPPGRAPQQAPVPVALLDWFHAGAASLRHLFGTADPGERVWTWSADQSVGFWQRDVTGSLRVRGDSSLLSRYFALVPPS